MFFDAERCPCIFARHWSSHEVSCAAVGHNCISCRYCMANISYWGLADEVLRTLASPHPAAASPSMRDAQWRYSGGSDASGYGSKGGRGSIHRWSKGSRAS